jgi:hypothetical protein
MKKRLYALAGAAALVLALHPASAFATGSDHDPEYPAPSDGHGSVTVTKVVTGTLAPTDDVFYTVDLLDADGAVVGTQWVSGGHSVTWDDLPAGTYSLREAGDPTFTATWWPSSTVVVDEQHPSRSVTLTNDFGDGSVTLTKTVEGEIAPPGAAFSFALVDVDAPAPPAQGAQR